jgi:PAS domain S-box-containing protein
MCPDRLSNPTTPLGLLGDLAHIGFFQVDAERNVTAVSPELTRITGFTEEEVLGKTCLSLLRCPTCLKGCGVFKHGKVQDVRLSIYRKDGSELKVERSGICLRDEHGAVTGALETVREIGRVDEEDAACGSPGAVEAMMAGLGRLFVAADGDFRIRAFSDRLPGLLGLAPEDVIGLPLGEILGDELFGPEGELRRAVEEGRRKEGWRAYLPTVDGDRIPVSLSVGPIAGDTECGHPDVRLVVMMRRDDQDGPSAPEVPSFQGVVGRSQSMQRIFRLIELLEESDSTVLITGESGTGKELVAHAVHATSRRRAEPFVAVNCAALPADLLESELFGHVRGAFTGAVRDRAGRFEMADGGTLFLDEIGDLDLTLQGKILRALQERTFERVGESRSRTVDVRVIAATNEDLERAVAERRFRDDLYYRLKVIPIRVPPLRERREDLPSLVEHFLDRMGARHRRALRLSPSAIRELLAYAWPGNVRELENALEFAVTVCEGQTIHVPDLPPEIRAESPLVTEAPNDPGPLDAPVSAHLPGRLDLDPHEAAEATRIHEALVRSRFNRADAARTLEMSRTTLWRKMKEYRL